MDIYRTIGRVVIFGLAAVGGITILTFSCADRNQPPLPTISPATQTQATEAAPIEPNGGIVHITDAQAAAVYPAEFATDIQRDLGAPDIETMPKQDGSDPRNIHTWGYNLPDHRSLVLLIGNDKVVAINVFDENHNTIRTDIDQGWYNNIENEQSQKLPN